MQEIIIPYSMERNRRIWERIAYNMNYSSEKAEELVLSHICLAPCKQSPDGTVEYSTPLWRPIYLDRHLIGKDRLDDINPGYYLGTITFKLFDPDARLEMYQEGGSVRYRVSLPKDKPQKMPRKQIVLSDLRPVPNPNPTVEHYSIWQALLYDINYCYNQLQNLLG